MRYAPHALFLAALAATAALVAVTTAALPDRVATHFGASGLADGWMTRGGYRVYMLSFAIGFPLFVVAMVGLLPRLFPRAVNLPHRDHWLGPERREEALGYLLAHACWLGVLMVAMVAGVHCLLVQANAAAPPQLPTAPFLALLAAFFALLGIWIVALYRRFRVSSSPTARSRR